MKAQTNRRIRLAGLQKKLRNGMTEAERVLWRRLRHRQLGGFKFRRQHPFADYILDFVCLEAGLVVEVDGGQHAGSQRDVLRDAALEAAGFRVLRFWNGEVLAETHTVAERVRDALAPGPAGTTHSPPKAPPC